MIPTAAVLSCVILAALAVFQSLLVAGWPLGRFAWGGQHEVLPRNLRIGSLISIGIYGVIAVVLLERSGLLSVVGHASAIGSATWVIAGYFLLGTGMNAISPSRPERYTMTPVALVLAALSAVVAS